MPVDAGTSPSSPYRGHNAIVFGGASGIGAATALLLAERGAAVTIDDRDTEMGEHVAASCRSAGARAGFARADVTDDAHVGSAVQAAVDQYA